MFMTILVGNSSTRRVKTAGGIKMVTPRGYQIKDESFRNEPEKERNSGKGKK